MPLDCFAYTRLCLRSVFTSYPEAGNLCAVEWFHRHTRDQFELCFWLPSPLSAWEFCCIDWGFRVETIWWLGIMRPHNNNQLLQGNNHPFEHQRETGLHYTDGGLKRYWGSCWPFDRVAYSSLWVRYISTRPLQCLCLHNEEQAPLLRLKTMQGRCWNPSEDVKTSGEARKPGCTALR